MESGRLNLLTEQQREYLRRAGAGETSKQIAQAVGGSHHTVNAEIAIACKILGAKSRIQAAKILGELESAPSYDSSYDPPALVAPSEMNPSSAAREALEHRSWLSLPVPTSGRPTNDLTIAQRIFWIITLAAIIALIFGGLLSGIIAQLDGLARHT